MQGILNRSDVEASPAISGDDLCHVASGAAQAWRFGSN
jgi:hypothetical protein